jgi:receptor expression-enhancing protein 5/6
VAFLGLYLVIGYGAGLVVNLLGFVYPAFKSCQAIDSEDKDDDTQWLTYWVVYAAFGIIEYFTDIFLGWVPFYFLAKCAFLVWCMLPMENNGSVIIYHRFIKPFVKKHESTIDTAFKTGQQLAGDVASKATSKVREAVGNVDPLDAAAKFQDFKQQAEHMMGDKEKKQD